MPEDASFREPARRSRYQFGLSSLFVLTLLAACILSIYRCLGPGYGWLNTIPLGIVGILLLCTHWRCAIGALVGAAVLTVFGVYCIIRFQRSDPLFVKAAVTLGAFGGAFGASVHAIFLQRRILGGLLLAAAILVFVAVVKNAIPPTR